MIAVKMNAARLDGPDEKCAANLRYSGHRAIARIVAQISAGKNPAAVHTARPNRTRASTTRPFMRAPAPKGRGFFSILVAGSSIRSDAATASIRRRADPLFPVFLQGGKASPRLRG